MKKFLSVILSAAMLFNAAMPIFAEQSDIVDISDSLSDEVISGETVEHAYDPIAEAEAEQAYRESVNFTAGKVVFSVRQYRQDGVKFGYLNDSSPMLKDTGLKNVTYLMDFESDTADEKTGYTAYNVYYEAETSDDVWLTVDRLKEVDGIISAEPDFVWNTSDAGDPVTVSGDEIKSAWFLENDVHDIKNVWDKYFTLKAPGAGVVVAVIDTGVDYTHKDLAANMWVNDGEIPDNGIDDDGNGYIDDYRGVNFITNGTYPGQNDPMDDMGHGTHVSGIIAMTPGNGGGVGVAYGAKIMAIKAGQATGSFASTDIAKAITYAKANGADVINMSFGGTGKSSLVESALKDAFGQCVLVASAGNDGCPTTDYPLLVPKEDIYPAGYNYVIGVMAEDASGNLAGFSNWDYIIGKNCEYEIAAPGVGIYSTLPNNKYALWSGTSMAAPIVAAEAAIIRSYRPDKNYYTNRYIMGQIVSATEDTALFYDSSLKETHIYPSINIYDSIYKQPKPELNFTEIYTLDSKELSDTNNGNGIIQSGETVDLAFSVFNRWGIAGDVSVTANADSIAGIPNPYVEFITDNAELDNVGTFATINNGYTYENDELVSVSKPIRFKIKDTAPNDAEIAINLTLTAKNDMDKTDNTLYSAGMTYTFRVQKGHALSGVIREDMTLTADEYWIIENGVLIPEGVTITVEPGTQIQFWSADESNPYGDDAIAYIQVEGRFICNGTYDKPISMFPGKGYEEYEVLITGSERLIRDSDFNSAYVLLEYTKIINPGTSYLQHNFFATDVEHCVFTQNYNFIRTKEMSDGQVKPVKSAGCHIRTRTFKNSIFRLQNTTVPGYGVVLANNGDSLLFDNCVITFGIRNVVNSVLLNDCAYNNDGEYHSTYLKYDSDYLLKNCAVLNRFSAVSDKTRWFRIFAPNATGYSMDISNNYWGTENENIIKSQVYDADWNIGYSDLIQAPWLTLESDSLADIYPFVTRACLTDKDGNEITTVSGSQEVTFHVLFNRDMASDIQPDVTFGGSEPFNDYTVTGDWATPREWQGTMIVDPFINQGRMYMRIKGAAAADDKWLVTGDDHERFFFDITKSEAQTMALQGTGLLGKNQLSWYQDDYETLAGYNLYRSTSYDPSVDISEQGFTKINTSVIPYGTEYYNDEAVESGVKYYYYFTVVDTDFKESQPSNIIDLTPLDGEAPVIAHTAVKSVEEGKALNIQADVTDDVIVTGAAVYYRCDEVASGSGISDWSSRELNNVSGSSYQVKIPANEITGETLYYYLIAGDGTNTANFGTAEEPVEVTVVPEGHNVHTYKNGVCVVCGAHQEPEQNDDGFYEIGSAGELFAFAELVNSGANDISAVLTSDIVINDKNTVFPNDDTQTWTPIGNSSYPFTGEFDGQNHSISGLYVNTGSEYSGLFGYVSSAPIKNIGIENSYIKGGNYTGALIGSAGSCNSGITGCYGKDNTVIGNDYTGGLIGSADYSPIENCYNADGSVTGGNYVGGLVGYAYHYDKTASYCYNTAAVSGTSCTGGTAGSQSGGLLRCYYLNTSAKAGASSGISRTAEKFANGTVAYALNDSAEGGGVWYQNIEKGEADSSPVLAAYGGEHYAVYDLAASYSNYRRGDLNRDDVVNDADAKILMSYINGMISAEDFTDNYNKKAADMNDDADIDILDAISILSE